MKLPDGWHSIHTAPPDELLEVIDGKGNKAFARPTYYPFYFDKQGKTVPCKPYWDSGWMVHCPDITPPNIGTITGWRKSTNPPYSRHRGNG